MVQFLADCSVQSFGNNFACLFVSDGRLSRKSSLLSFFRFRSCFDFILFCHGCFIIYLSVISLRSCLSAAEISIGSVWVLLHELIMITKLCESSIDEDYNLVSIPDRCQSVSNNNNGDGVCLPITVNSLLNNLLVNFVQSRGGLIKK